MSSSVIYGRQRSWQRKSSSLIARLNLHRLLGREPAGFDRLFRDTLAPIDGWRFRQDLVLLYLLARDVPGPEPVLEIGSYRGLSTTALGLGSLDAATPTQVHAVDPHTGDRQDLEFQGRELIPSEAQFRANLARAGLTETVTAHVMTSDDLAAKWDSAKLRVLFIDGWHSYEAVRNDIEKWVPLVTERGVVLIDDCRNYDEVAEAIRDSFDLLPPMHRRAGRMWLGHREPLPPDVDRLLAIPWG